jgi:hypothetical protein
MKKLSIAFSLVILSTVAFAKESVDSKGTKGSKQEKKANSVECTPSTTKVFHHVSCPSFSWYTVDYVDTTIVTCENGVAVSRTYHWDQNPNLVCS